MKYILKGLDCPNCAMKIETKINHLEEIKNASLSFATGSLEVELKNNVNEAEITAKIKDLIKELEPEVEVLEKIDKQENNEEEEENSKFALVKILLSGALFAGRNNF